ncbi:MULTISPECIES: tRNA lysidine(34) synthetase TilS [unclassified Yoonia]|uniref:tRNA lysidine(34) synthetase TilS n=1 Tax=unclassified Yoonia TaxID=2629118 RepID=UPI002AFF165B|nr:MULTISPECIES: tRNA lysidine(34) synthetase TilS [unclassified Yoonia]
MPVTSQPPRLAPAFIALLQSGCPVGFAVSGGGDSLALLHLAAAYGGRISVASVDHGLRPESAIECAMVAGICRGYGFAHQTLKWTGWDGRGNLQDQARQARYHLLAGWAQAQRITDIALGHTADDQVETIIMALARGAGVDGLAGMAPVTLRDGLRYHRPLLHVTRSALRDDLSTRGHVWYEDPSNDDPAYTRIRIRQAAGLLAELGLTPQALGQVAQNMAAAAAALDDQTVDLARACLLHQKGDVLVTLPLRTLSQEQARRLVLAAMGQVNRHLAAPRRDEQLRLMQSLFDGQGATLGGCLMSFEGPVLRVGREPKAVADLKAPTTALWDGRWRLSGPHAADLAVRALGAGIDLCPDWRHSGLPRRSLQATPAVWRGDMLVSAPLAGFGADWSAQIVAE